jgi:hypothetical protein
MSVQASGSIDPNPDMAPSDAYSIVQRVEMGRPADVPWRVFVTVRTFAAFAAPQTGRSAGVRFLSSQIRAGLRRSPLPRPAEARESGSFPRYVPDSRASRDAATSTALR